MRTIEDYKTNLIRIIDEAKTDGIKFDMYQTKIDDDDEIIELGICISDGKDTIKIPIWVDGSIELMG